MCVCVCVLHLFLLTKGVALLDDNVLFCYYSQTDTPPDQKLKIFNQEYIQTIRSVLVIDSKKEKCLDAFLQCQELVEWLKTSLEGLFYTFDSNDFRISIIVSIIFFLFMHVNEIIILQEPTK